MKKFTIAFAAILLLLGMTSADAAPKKEKIKNKKQDISAKEKGKPGKQVLNKFDKDGDGKLSDEEKKLLKYSERTTKAKELNLLRCSTQTVMASLAKMKEKP